MLATTSDWFNTDLYTPLELGLFLAGCLGWVVAYVGVIAVLRKRKFVEIPAGAVAANIAWEFVWGFLYETNMGQAFVWGYRAWFFLDVFIVWALFRYGHKQLDNDSLRRFFKPAVLVGILAWGIAIYFQVGSGYPDFGTPGSPRGYDTGYGAISGYILNVMMSALYILLILKRATADFSMLVAWSKMLGTAVLSVFNAMVRPEDGFLMTLVTVTFLLDVFYILVFYWRRGQERSGAADGAG